MPWGNDSFCLLSEIHPLGVSRFNPLQQACDWYGLVKKDEVQSLIDGDLDALRVALDLIHRRAAEAGSKVVVRDWAHLDWLGSPFLKEAPEQSSWDAVNAPTLLLSRCATVRHPVDQFLSTKQLAMLKTDCTDEAIWRSMKTFAESIQAMPWFRYEDFLEHPAGVLSCLCDVLGLPYDENWSQQWVANTRVTGEIDSRLKYAIKPLYRRNVRPEFWASLHHNQDFLATLDLLRYSTPEPLRTLISRPNSFATCDVQSDAGEFIPRLPPSYVPTSPECAESCAVDRDELLQRARSASAIDPLDVTAQLRLIDALLWIGLADEAADRLLKLASHGPVSTLEQEVKVLTLACETLASADRKFESLVCRRRLAQLQPRNLDNLFQASVLAAGIGEVDESLTYCRRLLEIDRNHTSAAANYLLYINYSDKFTPSEIANEHFRLGMRFSERPDWLRAAKPATADRIRVGYLSADFYTHPVGKLILPVLQSHSRDQFSIHVYHHGERQDSITESTKKAVDSFEYTHGWDDRKLLEKLRGDDLDVLVDLGGYTGGGNRLRVLARRAAPHQVSFLGYPHTSALNTIDYRLTDRFADPPGLTEHFYGEQWYG